MISFNEIDEIEKGIHPLLVRCDHCNGYGSSLKEEADTCTQCAGTGYIGIEGLEIYIEATGWIMVLNSLDDRKLFALMYRNMRLNEAIKNGS